MNYSSKTEIIKENGSTLYVFQDQDINKKKSSYNGIPKGMQMIRKFKCFLQFFTKDWRRYLVLIAPLALIWFPLMSDTSEARCGYVISLMAIYYMTEALPLSVTAMMPIFAFPFLGILSTDAVCRVYLKGTAMMYFGGLIVAVAVEHCNLHKRIALFVILRVGQSPRKLMGSFMLTTMFLSMWIANTSATAMMVPILDAILQELYKNEAMNRRMEKNQEEIEISKNHFNSNNIVEISKKRNSIYEDLGDERSLNSASDSEERLRPPDKESQALSTMYFLAVAYGSNLGGTGFPTGSAPNVVLWGILQSSFPEGTGLTFANWMAFNIPGMLLCVTATWIWLEILFMGCCGCRKFSNSSAKEKEESIRKLVQKHYDALGEISFHEISVILMFIILVLLWVFRSPQFITGWADVVRGSFPAHLAIDAASPAFLIVFLLFVIPSKPPWWNKSKEPTPACLTWDAVHKKVPWGLVILMGGGFAMAEGASASGLSEWLRLQLQVLQVLPAEAIVFLVCLITTFLTEIISNVTAASIVLPLLRDMAIGLRLHPLYLMLPGVLCCSYAFMLPVANPPNAIAFNASTMKNSDMMKAGFVLNFISVFIITGLINTLGVVLFDLHTFPSWAGNSTSELAGNSILKMAGNSSFVLEGNSTFGY